MIERQELFCHECKRYVQFDIDVSLNGNHILECPNCGHEHCRVVENGKVTDVRWGQRNSAMQNFNVQTANVTSTIVSTYSVYKGTKFGDTTGDSFMYSAWMNTTSTT